MFYSVCVCVCVHDPAPFFQTAEEILIVWTLPDIDHISFALVALFVHIAWVESTWMNFLFEMCSDGSFVGQSFAFFSWRQGDASWLGLSGRTSAGEQTCHQACCHTAGPKMCRAYGCEARACEDAAARAAAEGISCEARRNPQLQGLVATSDFVRRSSTYRPSSLGMSIQCRPSWNI